MVDYTRLGERIRARRKELGLTQENIATAAEIATNTVSNIENDKTKVSLPTLVEIVNFLGVTVDYVLCDSLDSSGSIYNKRISELLETCTPDERRIVLSTITALVESLHQ